MDLPNLINYGAPGTFPVVHLIRLRILPEPAARSLVPFCTESIMAKKRTFGVPRGSGLVKKKKTAKNNP